MPTYENSKDREQQKLALFQMERHLLQLGVSANLVETEERQKLSYDARMYVNGMFTGIVEVKCRNYTSDQIEDWGGFLIEVERLSRLKKEFFRPGLDCESPKGDWNKEIIFLFRCLKDQTCWAIHIREIIRLWDELPDAPPGMIKDDHGKIPADKSGKLIPLEHMETFT